MNRLETTLVVAIHSGKPLYSKGQVCWPALAARIKSELTRRSHGRRPLGLPCLGLDRGSSAQLWRYAAVRKTSLAPSNAIALRGPVCGDRMVRPWI